MFAKNKGTGVASCRLALNYKNAPVRFRFGI